MGYINLQIDRLIKTSANGTIIFRANPFGGKRYIIPTKEQAALIRLKIRRFLIQSYIGAALLFIAISTIGDTPYFNYLILSALILFLFYRSIIVKKLTHGLETTTEE